MRGACRRRHCGYNRDVHVHRNDLPRATPPKIRVGAPALVCITVLRHTHNHVPARVCAIVDKRAGQNYRGVQKGVQKIKEHTVWKVRRKGNKSGFLRKSGYNRKNRRPQNLNSQFFNYFLLFIEFFSNLKLFFIIYIWYQFHYYPLWICNTLGCTQTDFIYEFHWISWKSDYGFSSSVNQSRCHVTSIIRSDLGRNDY